MDLNLDRIKNEYPFHVKTFEAGGLRLRYLDEGPGSAPCVVMLHGNPAWSFYYRKLALDLRRDFRVVAPDHIGCGLSDKPQDYDYTLETHINNLERLIESLGLNDIRLVVHDWGGAIGMGYAVRHPENIKAFTVFNTAAFLSSRIPFRIRVCRLPVFGDVAVRGLNAFAVSAVMGMATAKKERFTPEVKAGYLAPYNSWANRVAILRFVQDIPLTQNDKSYNIVKDIEERLTLFRRTPIQILWGMRDFCFDEVFLEQWKEKFPDALVHQFDDAGHYVVEDAWERIIPIMRRFYEGLP